MIYQLKGNSMSTMRFKALDQLFNRKPVEVYIPGERISDYYGTNVFDRAKMKKYLTKEAYQNVANAIEHSIAIDRKVAAQVANGMKSWAVEQGATHYTHWFQPLTGTTAEKHDAFFIFDDENQVIERFDGENLVQQEPDASSFPSGGLRNTFEARGYTAWDPSSPAFIIDKTLCIPTVFISYTGEALDYKTPLLRSLGLIDKAATEVCQLFDKNIERVQATLGWEQEYFLIDEALFMARPDLLLTGRTLIGHASARDQQLEDHYFGSIPLRVQNFMRDFEIESHLLGIPVKTRHNEVAPNQFECAPMFEEANLAVDHNQLLMDVMEKVARRHNFRVLFHEKPFRGINGSGKHNNWSLRTNTGINLLSPGKNPKSNLMFLTFLVNIVKAVHEHGDLLRASIASLANEHRLGASEAPPAIISVFLGTQLNTILDDIETKVHHEMSEENHTNLKLELGKIPEIFLDNTDRNRTSPFAFTGNRFEFRAVGSSANCASPMTFLNLAVADRLKTFKTEVLQLIDEGLKRDDAILQVLKRYIIESKAIRFEGNGYGDEWKEEAKKRGLSNIVDALEAYKAMLTEKSIKLCVDNHIFNVKELHSRYEILVETFCKKLQIESRVLGDLAANHIVPTVYKYQNTLIDNVKGLKEVLSEKDFEQVAGMQLQCIKEISGRIALVNIKVKNMLEARKKANLAEDILKKAEIYNTEVKPYLGEIRYQVDHLERIVDDQLWPLPKYRELLFTR